MATKLTAAALAAHRAYAKYYEESGKRFSLQTTCGRSRWLAVFMTQLRKGMRARICNGMRISGSNQDDLFKLIDIEISDIKKHMKESSV